MIPYHRFYPSRALSWPARRNLDPEEFCLFWDLWCLAWQRGPDTEDEKPPYLPPDEDEIWLMSGWTEGDFKRLWPKVRRHLKKDETGLYIPNEMKAYEETKSHLRKYRDRASKGGKAKAANRETRTELAQAQHKQSTARAQADPRHSPAVPRERERESDRERLQTHQVVEKNGPGAAAPSEQFCHLSGEMLEREIRDDLTQFPDATEQDVLRRLRCVATVDEAEVIETIRSIRRENDSCP